MEVQDPEDDHEPEVKPKLPRLDTKLISYGMFKSGKSIVDVAKERQMTFSTIETHLAHFVGTGELDIERLIDPDKLAVISAWFIKNNTSNLTPAKAELGEDYSYSELRLVLKHLQFKHLLSI